MRIVVWDIFSVLVILGIASLVGFYGVIFMNPYVPFNPFPPPMIPQLAVYGVPSQTPTLRSFQPTWTSDSSGYQSGLRPTRTWTPSLTFTLTNTVTNTVPPSATNSLTPIPSSTYTLTPTATYTRTASNTPEPSATPLPTNNLTMTALAQAGVGNILTAEVLTLQAAAIFQQQTYVAQTQAVQKTSVAGTASAQAATSAAQTATTEAALAANPTSATETNYGATDGQWEESPNASPTFRWTRSQTPAGATAVNYEAYFGPIADGDTASATLAQTADFIDYNPAMAVPDGDTYYLRVRTVTTIGVTDYYRPWVTLFTFKYDGSLPTNPDTLTGTGGADDGVRKRFTSAPTITWSGASDNSPGSGLSGYNVEWIKVAGPTVATFVSPASYTPSLPDTGSYNIRIQAVDDAGNTSGGWYAPTFTWVVDNSAPSVPPVDDTLDANFVLIPSGIGEPLNYQHSTPTFTWTASTESGGGTVAGYDIHWSINYPSGDTVSYTSDTAVFDAPEMNENELYHLRVRARDDLGNTSNWSGVYSIMFTGVP